MDICLYDKQKKYINNSILTRKQNKTKQNNHMEKEKENEIWNISLNISSSSSSSSNQHMIGKNITYSGNNKYIYQYKDTIIVGHGRIYNELDLWINVLRMNHAPLVKIHPLVIVIELYNKFGFEKTLEYLDGDFSFILFDINLYGDESIIYVAKDPFGLCPLYQWISKNNSTSPSSKKVQFQDDTEQQKQYVFSSSMYINETEPIFNGNYHIFTHSFKVSATWKLKKICKYYTLPFYTTYIDEAEVEATVDEHNNQKQIEISVNKRIKYILHLEKKCAQLQNQTQMSDETRTIMNKLVTDYNTTNASSKIRIGMISFENEKDEYPTNIFQYLETKYNTKIECIKINIVGKNILELEEQYQNIIHNLKTSLNTNDPSIIRACFIPWMIAKHIKETEPDIKYIFMGEPFVTKWISTNVFDRREELNNPCFLEKLKGWVSAFFEYDIELIIPFLDRILIQKI